MQTGKSAAVLPRFCKKRRNLPNIGKFCGGPFWHFAKAWQKRPGFAEHWQIGFPP